MPDQFGNMTEAEMRGQTVAPVLPYIRPTREVLAARDAAARAGMGTVTTAPGQTLTGDAFRASTDPTIVALRENMQAGGHSDPNLLFGAESGREMSPEERQYRHDYHNFMRNPNSGVDHNEALRAAGLFALAPIAGYALGPAGAAAPAVEGAAAVSAAAPAATLGGLGGGAGTLIAPTAAEAAAGLAGTVAGSGVAGGLTGGQIAALGTAGAATGATLGGMGGGSPSTPNSGWSNSPGVDGPFANGGQGGMTGVGGGNSGALADSGAIATTGETVGTGTKGLFGGVSAGGGDSSWMDFADLGSNMTQSMGGGQQAQPYQGRSAELERQRRLQEEADRQKALAVAALRNNEMYSPA